MRYLLVFLCACGVPFVELASGPRPVVAGHVTCGDGGFVQALTDAGDTVGCTVPTLSCDPSIDLLLVSQCHTPASTTPATACCDPRPAGCAPSDCDCMLRTGPWIDVSLAADAGTTLVAYSGPKRKCSYRVSCTPSTDGGVPVLSCTPA